jgi:predicted secreted hydrolase
VTLPQDDGFQVDFPTQWWYWTGHLTTADGRRFGFEVCFFAFHADVLLGQLLHTHLTREGWLDRLTKHLGFQMVHTALSDIAGREYQHTCAFAIGEPAALDGAFQLTSHKPTPGAITAAGGNGRDLLHVALDGWGLDLDVTNDNTAHPPVLQYGGQAHVYPFGGFTYYYSRPRMSASGTIRVNGETLPVTGTVWFDRQYGELNQVVESGWQWFAIELEDREIVIFDITGQPSQLYCAVSRGADVTMLPADQVGIEVLDHWTSPVTHIPYPSKWRLTLGGETLMVVPLLAAQELTEPFPWPPYWEGDSLVTMPDGRAIGQAYVELSGFKRA